MKSTVDGLYPVESLVTMAQRLMARLQDAGVTHVRDVALGYDPANFEGVRLELGTLAGPQDEIDLECDDLALAFPRAKLAVLRPLPIAQPGKSKQRPKIKPGSKPSNNPNTVLLVRPHQD